LLTVLKVGKPEKQLSTFAIFRPACSKLEKACRSRVEDCYEQFSIMMGLLLLSRDCYYFSFFIKPLEKKR
jgi:hypothetical protein